MADLTKMAGVLAGPQGVLSQYMGAAPTYAQKAMNFLGGIPGALYALTKGDTYGTDPNSPVADLAKERFWRGSVFGAPEDVKQRNIQNALAVAMAAPTVYHGSPHKFDKFDSSKIGTGEGAQAYGHGLYFAENPSVAKQYVDDLGKKVPAFDGVPVKDSVESMAHDILSKYDPSIAKKVVDSYVNGGVFKGTDAEAMRAKLYQSIDRYANAKPGVANTGTLYKVDLPDSMAAKMLDWDKPLIQQPKNVQAALNIQSQGAKRYSEIQDRLRDLMYANGLDTPEWNALTKESQKIREGTMGMSPFSTGQDLLNELSATKGGRAKVSEYLHSLGIPGIRYLDQGSRGAGQGTYNYVAFPGTEDALRILERK